MRTLEASLGTTALLAALLAPLSLHCGSDTSAANGTGGPDGGGIPDSTANDGFSPVPDTGSRADVGVDAHDAAPIDPCAGRIVCDDFEKATTGSPPNAPWVIESNMGTAIVDEARAFSGKRSVKVSIDATSASDTYRRAMMVVNGAPLIPLANDTVFGRFMIWTDRIPGSTVHWTFASGHGPVGNLSAVYNYGGMGGLMANYYKNSSPNPTDCWQTKLQDFPTGAWTCVGFELDGANSEMRFWLNGVEIPELHVVGMTKTDQTCTIAGVDGRWIAPTFNDVSVGWESYQDDTVGAHDAWIDDVILDSKAIGCP